jgi:hypothetical protein
MASTKRKNLLEKRPSVNVNQLPPTVQKVPTNFLRGAKFIIDHL